MSYSQDFDGRSMKIPYDDIPISRNQPAKNRGGYRQDSGGQAVSKTIKSLISLVAVLMIVNLALLVVLVVHISSAVVKNVNINNISVDASDNVSASTAAAAKAKWSTVCVAAGGTAKDEYSFLTSMQSRGAGIIYKIDEAKNCAYFITCQHVINGYEDSVYVLIPSQLVSYKVEVVASSLRYDLAVLKLEDTNGKDIKTGIMDSCTAVSIADSAILSQGEPVIACGNPLSGGLKITTGVISSINDYIRADGSSYDIRCLQFDASINPGNSGGGLFDGEGNFIGIVNTKLYSVKTNGTYIDVSGQAFAIPGNLVQGFANNAIANDDNNSATMVVPKFYDIDAVLSHNQNAGRSHIWLNGKDIDTYVVEIKFGSSLTKKTITKFTYTDVWGNTKTVNVYNKYAFDDVVFNIKPNTEIKFYNEDTLVKTIVADSEFVQDEK